MRNINKFRGCLIGGAAGDALGYAVEFKREDEIFSEYGEEGITKYDLILTEDVAEISDDTQMTLFTAEGLLLAGREGDSVDYINYIRNMYKCWYLTQGEQYPLQNDNLQSRLLRIPELFNRRCPGATCMSAIMTGAEAAALTHGHDLGFIPAAALVHIVRAVAEKDVQLKDAVNDAILAMKKLFPKAEHIDEFIEIMHKAVQLAETEIDALPAIHQLGEGWVAEETLAIAVYCALKYEDDFDMALRASVNHNGDSDSTGAVCGNILGAYIGYDAIPQKYKERLELHDTIIEITDNLCNKV